MQKKKNKILSWIVRYFLRVFRNRNSAQRASSGSLKARQLSSYIFNLLLNL